MIYLCSTTTEVHCDSEVTAALVWVLRALSVFIMPQHRDTNSGPSCAGSQGWNGAANGPRVSWTAQRCFSEAQRQVVLFFFAFLEIFIHPSSQLCTNYMVGSNVFCFSSSFRGQVTVGLEADPIPALVFVISSLSCMCCDIAPVHLQCKPSKRLF